MVKAVYEHSSWWTTLSSSQRLLTPWLSCASLPSHISGSDQGSSESHVLSLPGKEGTLYSEFPCSQQQFHSTLWFSVLLFLGPGWKCWFNTDPFLIRAAGWGEMRPLYWDVERQRGLDLWVGSAVPELPSMHRLWKLVVSEWIAVNAGRLTARNLQGCFHRAEEKSFQQMERRGSVDYTCSSRPGVMVETEREDWKDPLQLLFSFLFSLCCIYQWDGDIRVWNGIPGVCLMTFLAVWRRWTDVFVLTEYFHGLPCGTENAKVRIDHWASYLWLSQGSLKFGWSWGPDK